MEKINTIRKTLIFLIIIFIAATFLTLLMTSIWKNHQSKMYTCLYTTRDIYKYPCLVKGEICSNDDINRAIKTKIKVSDSKAYDFYLISNDENTATFIMASNIVDNIAWQRERINIKGPATAYRKLIEETKDWNKIPIIVSYEYVDEGYNYYQDICKTNINNDPKIYYDCTNDIIPTRGYKGIKIENGQTTILYNLPEDETGEYSVMQDYTIDGETRARFIEDKELNKLRNGKSDYPDWLIDHLKENTGYWTMSSSTLPTIEYMQGAFAVINENNLASVLESYTTPEDNYLYNTIGIRPVITIEKEEKSDNNFNYYS